MLALPTIDIAETKFKIALYAAFKDVSYTEAYTAFKAFVLEKTKFPISVATNQQALEAWQEFAATQTMQLVVAVETTPETIEEKVVVVPTITVDGVEIQLVHNLIFNGANIRDTKRKLADRIDREGYTNWLAEQPVQKWLASIKAEFEDPAKCENPIPLDQPLLINVEWLPVETYHTIDNPSIRKDGVIKTYKTVQQVVSGKKATLLADGSMGKNSTEKESIYNQEFFYTPHIEEKTDGVITDEQGVTKSVVYLTMVAGTVEQPNHRWSSCLIQSLDRKTTYFNWQKKKAQSVENTREKHHRARTGFEDFQAQMLNGGYSDIFSLLLYKHNPDGTVVTSTTGGKPIVQRVTCRFRIAAHHLTKDAMQSTDTGLSHVDTYDQKNSAVDKSNRVWLDLRGTDGTWSVANSLLIGKGHFAGVNAEYDYKDYDSRVSREKTNTRHLGKDILALLKTNTPTTEKDIRALCAEFQHADLRYSNDILFYVRVLQLPARDNKGNIIRGEYTTVQEEYPIFKRYIKTHTVVSMLQENHAVEHYFYQWEALCKQAEKWLQKNVTQWLVMDAPIKPKTYKKKKVETYCMNRKLPFMAKQTVRWGSPVFTDTATKQVVTKEVIEEQLKGIVLGVLGDLDPKVWFSLKSKLIRFVASQKNPKWDSMSDDECKEYLNILAPTIKVTTPDDLFNPAAFGLQGSGETPPSDIWFRLIEQFYKAFGVGLVYTHYGNQNATA